MRTPDAETLAAWARDARERTLALVSDLTDAELMGPRLDIVNPLLWEIGHVAWFQNRWVGREAAGLGPVREDEDALYDSIAIAHDARWDLPLPSRADTLAYMGAVLERALSLLDKDPSEAIRFHALYTTLHEDMHGEAFTYTRQTLGYAPPPFVTGSPAAGEGPLAGDARIPGGTFLLGADPDREQFVFDNEKWEHEVELAPFSIARAAVTQAEFAHFVDEGGYRRDELWDDEGRAWRDAVGARAPLYWKKDGDLWLRRRFDAWVPLEPHRPVLHVCWHEAQAYCRFAGRRLPTEPEWEAAAAGEPDGAGRLSKKRRTYPWGEDPPSPERANLDGVRGDTVDVGALPAGDSAFGCRQMLGNVWEWTASSFGPFPGFVPDPYKEYSQPWFSGHRVLRGGCHATRSRLARSGYRNFYTPDRRDVWAGFRTCAL